MIAWLVRSPGSGSAGRVATSPVIARFTVSSTSAPAAGTNAADLYRQAMRLLAELQRDPADQAQFQRYTDGTFDAQAQAFFEKHAKITDLIRQGAAATTANWGEMDMQSRLNELNSIHSLFNLVMAESKFAVQQDNPALAIDDALAGMAMGRHLSHGGVLTSKLVEVGCDARAIDWLAQILPQLPSQQLATLRQRLDALPPPESGTEMMAAEFANAQSMQTSPAMLDMVNSMEDFYRNVGVAMSRPPEEFAKSVDAEVAKYISPTKSMLLRNFASSLKTARVTLAVGEARQAMLRTAIDVQIRGESGAAESIDPFGKGPFLYTKTANGFELSSQLQYKNAPVKLVVGK